MISVSLLREKALLSAISLSIKYFRLCNGWIDGFKQDTVVYRPASGECRTVGSSAVEVWRNEQLLKVIEGYEPENMYVDDEAGLFFMLPPNKTLSVKGNLCSGGKNSKDMMTVMSACNISATDTLPPLVVGKSEKSHCFENVRNLHAKYEPAQKCGFYTHHFYSLCKGMRCLNEF
jgi:hypothetical protein